MKKLFLILILSSCASDIVVRTDFDKSIEIHRRTKYAWLGQKEIESRNSPLLYNELNDKRVKAAVDAGMTSKGYQLDDSEPEFLIHYHVTIEDKAVRVETEPYGYSYGQFWKNNQTDVRRYREGTLILDFMDSGNCELIWRGWAVSILDEEKLVSEELIRTAVARILEQFPVSAEYEMKNY
jgi:hypothetical protein